MKKRNLLIVSNRLPISVKKTQHGLEFFHSAGGLATGVFDLNKKINSIWIGWPGISSDALSDDEKMQIKDELKRHNCYPIFLTQSQIDLYYNGYGNRIIWPLLHNIDIVPSDMKNQKEYWESYKEVNQIFAEEISKIDRDGRSSVWVHDYHLWLLPSILRERGGGQGGIGFFQHVPFPTPSRFSKLKQAKQLLEALVFGSDLIGFHTKKYVNNFMNACQKLEVGQVDGSKIVSGRHASRVIDFPMGIDYDKFKRIAESSEVDEDLALLRKSHEGRKVILAISRLDPIKGLVEKVLSYRKFLELRPDYHGRVEFIMIIVPSRTSLEQYVELERRLITEVNSTNEQFGTDDWLPIEFVYKEQGIHKLSALYQLADVALVTSLIDGMNLVAKEYVASRRNQDGVLILGNNTGAAEQLTGALIVNPYNSTQVANAIGQALDMPVQDQNKRMQEMQENVLVYTVHRWYDDFMGELDRIAAEDAA